ncbi:MAG: hypothetical protein L6R36_007227 [Xanthoria steineri]|nr:MAG: hypothetical protein L6R36_007227 [Xanthoria steineri]
MSLVFEPRTRNCKFPRTRPIVIRDPNARQPIVHAVAPSTAEKHGSPSPRQVTQKSDKENTLHHEQQRRTFLAKVRQKGEDKKWDIRGEQILREDFLTIQRHWIESQNLSAPPPLIHSEDDVMKEMTLDKEHQADAMIDRVLSQENEEVDALVSLFEEGSDEARDEIDKRVDYGTDDEKYDSIFLDLLSGTSNEGLLTPYTRQDFSEANNRSLATEAMDTSGG